MKAAEKCFLLFILHIEQRLISSFLVHIHVLHSGKYVKPSLAYKPTQYTCTSKYVLNI